MFHGLVFDAVIFHVLLYVRILIVGSYLYTYIYRYKYVYVLLFISCD